jgi:hypothetical protein
MEETDYVAEYHVERMMRDAKINRSTKEHRDSKNCNQERFLFLFIGK